MNDFEKLLATIFRDWGTEINPSEREALKKKATKYKSIDFWRSEHLAYVTTSGVAAGVTGGWWSIVALGAVFGLVQENGFPSMFSDWS